MRLFSVYRPSHHQTVWAADTFVLPAIWPETGSDDSIINSLLLLLLCFHCVLLTNNCSSLTLSSWRWFDDLLTRDGEHFPCCGWKHADTEVDAETQELGFVHGSDGHNVCEIKSSHRFSLCVYLWKQRNSENKDPISVITSNNSLVGLSSVRPLSLSRCLYSIEWSRSKAQTATIQLLYSAQTYGRKNVRPECMQIHKITFFLFLIKIQKLTISIKARPSTKNKQRRVTVATSCPTVCLSVTPGGHVSVRIDYRSLID